MKESFLRQWEWKYSLSFIAQNEKQARVVFDSEAQQECMSRRRNVYDNERSAWRITLFMKFDDV